MPLHTPCGQTLSETQARQSLLDAGVVGAVGKWWVGDGMLAGAESACVREAGGCSWARVAGFTFVGHGRRVFHS
jgi:hypothetical protein